MVIDIELTNRCNATCDFCPRDNMPKMGHMSEDTFKAVIDRVLESREEFTVSICGTGEPSIHPRFLEFMEYGLAKGVPLQMTTNGSRITRDVAQQLVDAGLYKVTFSITGIDAAYEEIYNLPFQQVRQNIIDFVEVAKGKCRVAINVVNYKAHAGKVNIKQVKEYWHNLGIEEVQVMKITNRGGAINIDSVNVSSKADIEQCLKENDITGYCVIAFYSHHIGWDGNYYLCCHDWKHEAAFGNVLHDKLDDIFPRKVGYFTQDDIICTKCSYYPPNVLMCDEPYRNNGKVISHEEFLQRAKEAEREIIAKVR